MTMQSWRWRTRPEESEGSDAAAGAFAEVARTASVGDGGAGAAAAALPATPAGVTVVFGPLIEPMSVVGMTVAEVRALIGHAFNVPATATALIDGARVRAGRRLAAGETLEFTRESGEKGAP
jgi:hypothetical protein